MKRQEGLYQLHKDTGVFAFLHGVAGAGQPSAAKSCRMADERCNRAVLPGKCVP